MKRTLLASIILGALALSTTNVIAATSIGYAYSNDGSNLVIGLRGQDEGDKIYDLDNMEDTLLQHQTTLSDHGIELNTLEGHVQSVDDLTHTLHINNIQDRAELDLHDKAIQNNAADITRITTVTADNSQHITLNSQGIGRNTQDIQTHTGQISSNSSEIVTTATGVVANKADIVHNAADIAQSKAAITGNTTAISANKADIAKNQSNISGLQSGFQQVQSTSLYAQSRADAAYANTETNRQALQATNHRVADNSAAIADHEQRIEKLEASNSANFGKLKNQVDDNRQRASAAISGVAAMANIPQVIQGQTFSVGAGVGTTDSESALAVGFSARAAEHVVVKASVSDDTQQNFVVGGGVSYGW